MRNKVIFIIFVLMYVGAAGLLFVKNKVLANEDQRFEAIVKKEKIIEKNQRSTLRAFYSAPPVIPHEVESQDSKDCLRCHLNVTRLDDGRVAMQTPHPQFSNCMQCHVPTKATIEERIEVISHWEGLKEPQRGNRWNTLSPPTIPHRLFLRENCLSCHGPQNPDMRLRTTHPHRTSCLQCHVPNQSNEF